MNCPTCGKENADGNWVCGHCGDELPRPLEPETYAAGPLKPLAPNSRQTSRGSIGWKLVVAVVVILALGASALWYFHYRVPDTGTPGGTMEAFFNAISNDDCNTAFDYIPKAQVPDNRDQAAQVCKSAASVLGIDYKDFKVLSETIDGDTAQVFYQIKMSRDGQPVAVQVTMRMIKEDGRWKVEGPA